MPPVQASAPAVGLPFVQSRFGAYGPTTTSSVSFVVRNGVAGQAWIITQIDFTATLAEPVQCFFAAALWPNSLVSGPTFYYDSQSTGEGNGVWFSWRGCLRLDNADAVAIVASSASSIVWGGVVSGYISP